jgi:integrase
VVGQQTRSQTSQRLRRRRSSQTVLPLSAPVLQALILVLYCTGIRFGEALRLRLRDVDTRAAVLFVNTFKGRARWIPFHRSLSRELDRYLTARVVSAGSDQDAGFFVGVNQQRLPVEPQLALSVFCLRWLL